MGHMPMFLDLSQSENLIDTTTTGTEIGLMLTHTPFACTRALVENNTREQFLFNTYLANSSVIFHMRIVTSPQESLFLDRMIVGVLFPVMLTLVTDPEGRRR